VIRVSGDKTREALKAITGTDVFNPRYATLKPLKHPLTSELIDRGLVLFFAAPRSFTGEDCAEFQVHGGLSVVSALLDALSNVKGLRPAEAGEFTRRAFYNGKMDLVAVEGLADLIHAETEFQRRQALIQADGHLSRLFQAWKVQLVKNVAHVEAYIDFSEDEAIEDGVLDVVQKNLVQLTSDIGQHLLDGRKGERLRDGVKMIILGGTNVGKSSLMNLLCRRDVSIVTNVEGTTRDVIESHYDIGGYPVVISDTAGLRDNSLIDVVESEGIARARKRAEQADLIVLVIDGRRLLEFSNGRDVDVEKYLKSYLSQLGLDRAMLKDKKLLTIVNKVDLVEQQQRQKLQEQNVLGISCTEAICGEPTHIHV